MNRESLSALLDGECRGAELDQLLEALDQEPALKAEWSRLCVARSALQRKTAAPDEAFVRNVMAAVAREPVVALEPAPRNRTWSWSWLRPMAGYSLAATAGAVAVFSMLTLQKPQDSTVAQNVALNDYQAFASADPIERYRGVTNTQLNSYLKDYNRTRARQGMSGSLGYARYAAHDAVYQTLPGAQ